MKIDSEKIDLFKNLSDFDLGEVYYDFHNDFTCTKISIKNDCLIFCLERSVSSEVIIFKFENISIKLFKLEDFYKFKDLTIDNFYRGRFEENAQLLELDKDGRSFFYLEFVQGIQIELWCKSIVVESDNY